MVAKVSAMTGPVDKAISGFSYLDVLPAFAPHNTDLWDLAVAVFIMPIAVQWWAVWYPGAEPGGGSYIAQRMLASKSERDSLGGVLFFNIAHYVLRPWPWILVGLCSLIVYPTLGDIKTAFPNLDPKWLGHDMAYPAMISTVLPIGWIGLMVGGLIAANSSTILTHLNWGASYLVHDFYKRFLRPGKSEHHYVTAGRLATVGLFLCAAGLTYLMTSAKDSFDVILQVGAGTGLLYILRWFWWRINAWCEIVAMVSSFLISLVFMVAAKQGLHLASSTKLVLTIVFTTICWVIAAYAAPGDRPRDAAHLLQEGEAVRPRLAPLPRGRGLHRRAHDRREHPARARRLGVRLRHHLVVALRGGQLPLRPHRATPSSCLAVFAVAGFVLHPRGHPALAGQAGTGGLTREVG